MRWRQASLTNVCGEVRPLRVNAVFTIGTGPMLQTRMSALIVSLLAASLAACAPAIQASGTLPPGWGLVQGQKFVLVGDVASDGGAGAVVTRLLEEKGLRRAGSARYRVDVALSASDPRISLAEDARPRQPFSLCRRRRYALTVAMIDQRDGTIVFRRGAGTRRCGELMPRFIERLATAALGS